MYVFLRMPIDIYNDNKICAASCENLQVDLGIFTFFLYFHREKGVLLYTSNQYILPQLSLVHHVTTGHDCQENVNLCESFSSSLRMSKFAVIINK